MRAFIASAVLIAALLIGQQWVVKASVAHGLPVWPTAGAPLR